MLRGYQSTIKNEIFVSHAFGNRNVLSVLPTGAGKTVCMAHIFKENENDPQLAQAHRQELVLQISMAFASVGLYHRIIAPEKTIRFIVERHIKKFTQSFFHPGAPTAVGGVDTLIKRLDDLDKFLKQCKLWQTDEAHHLQVNNKWGEVVLRMPQARGIGWTATPRRPNGQSLGRSISGVFDALVVGPSMRELITQGYLCEYIIYGLPNAIDTSGIQISSSTGDLNSTQLRDAAHRAQITGDLVKHYKKYASGKRTVVFAVDVALATEYAEAYTAAGIPAGVLHAKTSDTDRVNLLDKFERGEILVIVNVDVLGEGFDCPAIECVQMARPTESYNLFVQQFGRALRILAGKNCGIVIDHVGNIGRHGLPDAPREWSLDGIEKKPRPVDDLPVRGCPNPGCFRVFEGFGRTCPYCGFCPPREPAARPDMVEGDLTAFSPELMARLRGEADRIVSDNQRVPHHAGRATVIATKRRQGERRNAQLALREALAGWAGCRRDLYGDPDDVSYMRFFRQFGIDVMSAQTLNANDAETLCEKVWEDIRGMT